VVQYNPSNAKYVYSRVSAPNASRFEAILSSLLHGRVLAYSSGLSAFHALLVHYRPNVIAIGEGYHGCHGVIDLLNHLYGLKKVSLHDESSWDAAGLGKGDVIHVETPLNPTGEAVDLQYYAAKAKERGAILSVDATFGPPPLQEPFALGADIVMHSATKYLGGHSDLLCGVLVTQSDAVWKSLFLQRLYLGSVMGSLEGWLGVRSARTLDIRVKTQSANAERVVRFLAERLDGSSEDAKANGVVQQTVAKLQHASLQKDALEQGWLKKQMPNGYGPVFSIGMKDPESARKLPSKLRLFHHATSLGGVETLIEWRRMTDSGVDPRLLRVSIGLENWEDITKDLLNGLSEVAEEEGNGSKLTSL
jgi:cystathionine gamma-synthase